MFVLILIVTLIVKNLVPMSEFCNNTSNFVKVDHKPLFSSIFVDRGRKVSNFMLISCSFIHYILLISYHSNPIDETCMHTIVYLAELYPLAAKWLASWTNEIMDEVSIHMKGSEHMHGNSWIMEFNKTAQYLLLIPHRVATLSGYISNAWICG